MRPEPSPNPWEARVAEWSARPIFVLLIALVIGVSTRLFFWPILFAIPLAMLCGKRPAWVALGLGLVIGLVRPPGPLPSASTESQEIEGTFHVVQVPQNTRTGMRTVIERDSVRYLLRIDRGVDISFGDEVRLKGESGPLPAMTQQYWLNWGVTATLRPIGPIQTASKGWPIWRWGLRLRESFVKFTDSTLDDRAANVVDALCFNVDAELTPEFRDALAKSGTIHIISTSGVHVVIVAVMLSILLRAMPVPRWVLLVLLTGLLILYAGAAGFRAPAVRAVVMALVVAWAYALKRQGDPLSAWAFAAATHLVWTPEVLRDISFQLSFVIVGALVMFARLPETSPGDFLGGVKSFVKQAVWASVVATIASLPLIAYAFGRVSLVSIPANFAIAFVLTPIMVCALLAWLFSHATIVGQAVAAGLMQIVVEPLTGYLILMVRLFGDPSWAAVSVPPFHGGWVIAAYVAGILAWRPRRKLIPNT